MLADVLATGGTSPTLISMRSDGWLEHWNVSPYNFLIISNKDIIQNVLLILGLPQLHVRSSLGKSHQFQNSNKNCNRLIILAFQAHHNLSVNQLHISMPRYFCVKRNMCARHWLIDQMLVMIYTVRPGLFISNANTWWRLHMKILVVLLAHCEIHRWPVCPLTKWPVIGTFDVYLLLAWIGHLTSHWTNRGVVGDLRRYDARVTSL